MASDHDSGKPAAEPTPDRAMTYPTSRLGAKIELVNLAFSIDSILVAVAMSPKLWVVVLGGILGIVAMRVVVGQLISLVQRYPALVDGAFIIIAWVGAKLGLEYLHGVRVLALEIPQWLSLTMVVVIFTIAFIYAKAQGPAEDVDSLAEQVEGVLKDEGASARNSQS